MLQLTQAVTREKLFVDPEALALIRPNGTGALLYRIGSEEAVHVSESAARVLRMRAYWGTRTTSWAYVYMDGARVTYKSYTDVEDV